MVNMKAHHIDSFGFVDNNDGKCCWNGCDSNGEFPAPKSPNNTRERYHFCMNHVRQYNKSWDFFRGMSDDQVQGLFADSVTGHRPTSKMGVNYRNCNTDDLRDEVFREFKFGNYSQKKQKENITPETEMAALRVMGLNAPVTIIDIKRKYKELAKRYHPDVNGGVESEKLKVINQAYSYLKNCRHYS